jgi:SH3-like domain-containing protein
LNFEQRHRQNNMQTNWVKAVVRASGIALAAATFVLTGCNLLHVKPADKYVYVTAKEAVLRDRVAAVSNRTGTVTNGQKLVILEQARLWVKVKAPDGSIGWVQKKDVAEQALAEQFIELGKKHAKDSVVATATARDEVVLHITPGRKGDSFYRLAEGDSISLLQRATILKPVTPGAAPKPAAPKPGVEPAAPLQPVMEDWWLVRNARGDTGWMYSRLMDVSAPDSLVRYAEGQRIVGAYLIATVDDPDSGVLNNGVPVTSIPEYVTVLAPYKAGLPYDFDQVRVFTWNTKMHRYETAFREHGVEGYLPVKISNSPADKVQTFTYYVLPANVPTPEPDPDGELKPARTIGKTFRLENNVCRRVLPPGVQPPEQAKAPTETKAPVKKRK